MLNKPAIKKSLSINLVYMDDQSHILHALRDTRDMDAIRLNFGQDWLKTKADWETFCGSAIELTKPSLYRIDYIPPRVGILMETGAGEAILYAGRCSFRQTDQRLPVFTLDVGENEYLFYKKSPTNETDDEDAKAIKEFKAAFNAYRQSQNNSGVTPIWTSNSWIERLREYIGVPPDTKYKAERLREVTFISGTATKFESLIIEAVKNEARVRVYLHDTSSPPRRIRNLHGRLKRELGDAADSVEHHRYQHPATFRGVVIGNVAIGLQIYVNADDPIASSVRNKGAKTENVKKLPICFIITPCFRHFEELKQAVLGFATGDTSADELFSFVL